MEITVKRAESSDSRVISGLAGEIWPEHYSAIVSAGQINYMLEKFQSEKAIKEQIKTENYRYFIAIADGTPAAYCAVVLRPENELFLSKLYVKKEFRQNGIARRLLEHAAGSYDFNGKYTVYLTVNKNNIVSIAAYKRLGFEIACELVTDIGCGYVMDDYKMVSVRENVK